MAGDIATFKLDETVVYAGRPMRVSGITAMEGASGQRTTRYLLEDASGAPVLLEEGERRFALLRPFPAGAQPPASGKVVSVGREKYTLVGVRQLTLLAAEGKTPGGRPQASLLVSGIFEGEAGTLMREMAPGADDQVYFLVKNLEPGIILSAAQHSEARESERHAAGTRTQEQD
jgi:hypothetical protein